MNFRILAWNIGHQIRRKPVPDGVDKVVLAHDPDFVILSEFVESEKTEPFEHWLVSNHYHHIEKTKLVTRENPTATTPHTNGVLIASKFPLVRGDIRCPVVMENGYPFTSSDSSLLHVIASDRIEIVGLRIPWITKAATRDAYWGGLHAEMQRTADRPIVFIGDFNADPSERTGKRNALLRQVEEFGYALPEPAGPYSYYNSKRDTPIFSRIDHAALAQVVSIQSASYVIDSGDRCTCGPKERDPISDHAPLVVDLRI